jgi:hypothetical protein
MKDANQANSTRTLRWFRKFVKIVFVLQVGLILLADLAQHITAFEFWAGAFSLSIPAYFIYNHRHPRTKRQTAGSAPERTPVMPRRTP